MHMNWLHGATPKEGPSGAVTIVTSLLSIALNTPVPADITMTGEVTLNGKVLCIGGVRSKTVAGIRAGAKRFIFHQSTRTGKRRWLE
uniref:Lon proteolytic domain-containing protein n=1 Tax=Arcella intermedia TaxID=1963864 RepID=A0A6B2LUX4_9EUKA